MYTIGFTFFAPSNDVEDYYPVLLMKKKNIYEVKTQGERKEENVKKNDFMIVRFPFFLSSFIQARWVLFLFSFPFAFFSSLGFLSPLVM